MGLGVRGVSLLAAALVATAVAACRGGGAPVTPQGATPTASNASASSATASSAAGVAGARADAHEWFTDEARAAGIDFVHVNGASGQLLYPEILGPGVGLVDIDNDGDLDVYLPQGHPLDPGASGQPVEARYRGRLFRNDLGVKADGSPSLRFTDITDASGIDARGYGLGVAAGDVDGDGCVDLYLTFFGPNQLYRNNCDGTFTDITASSGVSNVPEFSVSAAFLDYDRDGRLDLYVANNVNYALTNRTPCPNKVGVPDYCPPQIYGGRPDRLYHNAGNGRFDDVTARALGPVKFGPALGVASADFNGDGWIDIYVANDGEPNLLFINQRNGTFKEGALAAGAAVTAEGSAEASMGVDAADVDDDGDEDLVMTELTSEGSNLFINDGSARFRDGSAASGLGSATLPYTGWGSGWLDYDNDGRLDHFAVNGTIVVRQGSTRAFPYDQPMLLLRNQGTGRFQSVNAQAGRVFTESDAGRGVAFGDIDNDGDIDMLVGNDQGPARLLINHVGSDNHWVGLRLVSPRGTPLLGAVVGIERPDGPTLWRRSRADGSYASANDPRVLVGLGASAGAVTVRVRWPNGREDVWPGIVSDEWHTLSPRAVP